MKNEKQPLTYPATLYLWSEIGHTPLTEREGAFCDELARSTVNVTDQTDAKRQLRELANQTPGARSGHYTIPTLPNQNFRTGWLSGESLRGLAKHGKWVDNPTNRDVITFPEI